MWIKIDDNLPDNPKIIAAGPMAGWLYISGLCFCNRYLTNGFIPSLQLARLTDMDLNQAAQMAVRLVIAGLWEDVPGGYQVHDYLKHQQSKERIEEIRQQRILAGSKGGRAAAKQNEQNASNLLGVRYSKTLAEIEVEEDIEIEEEKRGNARPPSKTLPAHPLPTNFAITDAMRQWATDKGVSSLIDLDKHTSRFVEYWTIGEGQGKRKKNWTLTWQRWMEEEAEKAQTRSARSSPNGYSRPAPAHPPALDPSKYQGEGKYAHLFTQPRKAKEHG